jgi:hypothetical protein
MSLNPLNFAIIVHTIDGKKIKREGIGTSFGMVLVLSAQNVNSLPGINNRIHGRDKPMFHYNVK